MADIPLFWDEDGDCTAEVVAYMNSMDAPKKKKKKKKKKTKAKLATNKPAAK